MSPKRAFAATALLVAAASAAAVPAQALPWPFGSRSEQPAPSPQAATAAPAAQTPAASAAEAPGPRRERAPAADRAAALRLDPLAQAAFWGREFEADGSDAEAGLNLARALRALGRHAEAGQAADQVLVLQPDNTAALLETARAKISAGQGFYAVAPLERARTLLPRDWRVSSLLGVAYHQTERRAEAQTVWAQALQLSAENPEVLSNMAMAAAADGDLAGAETLLRRASARPDASVLVRQNLALVLGLRGDVAGAEALSRRNLPPEQVNANLAWLRAGSSQNRSWESLRGAGAAGSGTSN